MVSKVCPPVMICGFNRPDCLKQVFDRVREARPSQLFLVLDAPREGRPKDVVGCEACRKIYEGVDWPCEVHRNYAEKNMGCRSRMGSAISWVFEHVDRAIILEDDCVPDLTFFPFCAELLERYKDDARIGGVCGCIEHPGFMKHPVKVDADYYFDRLNTCCGWATWRRAWSVHDVELKRWPELKSQRLFKSICRFRREELSFERTVQSVYDGQCSSWATTWFVSTLSRNMLFAHAVNNLITNVGFGADATHTASPSPLANLPTSPMHFPIRHPTEISPLYQSERYLIVHQYAPSLWVRILGRIKRILGRG